MGSSNRQELFFKKDGLPIFPDNVQGREGSVVEPNRVICTFSAECG